MRKTTLYGRRIRGDIGPLNTDPVRGLMARIIAPAVCLTGVYQDYDEEDVTQNFTIGSRMQVDDRVYYYSECNGAIAYPNTYRLAVSTDQILAANDCLSETATTVLGRTVTLAVAGFQGGVIPANDLQGGWVECNSGGILYAWRRIVSNLVAVGNSCVITVDRPFGAIFPIGAQISIHKSPYKQVTDTATAALVGFAAAVGLPPIEVTNDYFFWLQTYGPCFIGPTGGWPLGAADQYDVYYHQDGTTNSLLGEYAAGARPSPQRIGHVIGSGNYGSGAVFLEISN